MNGRYAGALSIAMAFGLGWVLYDLRADSSELIEVRCSNEGFDARYHCIKPLRIGAKLKITVNATTKTVLIQIVENDGNWFVDRIFLDGCQIASIDDWICETKGLIQSPTAKTTGHSIIRQ